MSHPSASFSATARVRLDDHPGSFAGLAAAIAAAGGSLGAIDLVRVERGTKVRDVAVLAADADHLSAIVERMSAVERTEVLHVSDRTFLINNLLAFPGVFRGALEVRAREITDEMQLAAAHALAAVIDPEHVARDYIVPSVFDRSVASAVAAAVTAAARAEGVARIELRPELEVSS